MAFLRPAHAVALPCTVCARWISRHEIRTEHCSFSAKGAPHATTRAASSKRTPSRCRHLRRQRRRRRRRLTQRGPAPPPRRRLPAGLMAPRWPPRQHRPTRRRRRWALRVRRSSCSSPRCTASSAPSRSWPSCCCVRREGSSGGDAETALAFPRMAPAGQTYAGASRAWRALPRTGSPARTLAGGAGRGARARGARAGSHGDADGAGVMAVHAVEAAHHPWPRLFRHLLGGLALPHPARGESRRGKGWMLPLCWRRSRSLSRSSGVESCHAGMAGIETNEQKRAFRCLIDHARGLRLPTHKAMESRSYESSDGTDHSHGYEEVCEPTQWCSRASRVRAAGAG